MIIPLGQHCNISFLNQGLGIKKETSVFEYFDSTSLQDITNVINTKSKKSRPKLDFSLDGEHDLCRLEPALPCPFGCLAGCWNSCSSAPSAAAVGSSTRATSLTCCRSAQL